MVGEGSKATVVQYSSWHITEVKNKYQSPIERMGERGSRPRCPLVSCRLTGSRPPICSILLNEKSRATTSPAQGLSPLLKTVIEVLQRGFSVVVVGRCVVVVGRGVVVVGRCVVVVGRCVVVVGRCVVVVGRSVVVVGRCVVGR